MTAPLDLEALRALAERATPGPWVVDERTGWVHRMPQWWLAKTGTDANAHYIAAVSPDTVLALIDAAEQAQRYREALQEIVWWGVSLPLGMTESEYNTLALRDIKRHARAALAAPEARQEVRSLDPFQHPADCACDVCRGVPMANAPTTHTEPAGGAKGGEAE